MALSMKASCNSHGQDSSYFLGWQEYDKNPYDHIRNPTGIIQMGLAENQLSFDLLESWLAKNHDAAAFKRNGKSLFKELALFQDYHGLPAFKNALAELMAEIRRNKVSFDPCKIVLTAGATPANETLMFCLAEPGDAILVPAPYYPGFDRDLKWRTGAEIVPVQCNSRNGFKLTETNLNEAYETARKLNLTVKSILITNPSNPLGTTMTRDELKLLIQFITSKRIHLVSDEIYAGTVFGSPKFISILEALDDRKHVNNDIRELVHVVHSLSKDLGLPGFRVGAIYSNNEAIISAATKMSSFGLVSSQTQHLLASILSDKAFTRTYISENRKRLKKRHRMLVLGLRDCGISCLESNAGLFCWADMRHLLRSNTFEAEMELWRRIVYDARLNVSPGTSCHCPEPGWFRVCFANVSEEALEVSIKRLKLFIGATYGNIPDDQKSKEHCSRKKWTLRLPFRGREPVER